MDRTHIASELLTAAKELTADEISELASYEKNVSDILKKVKSTAKNVDHRGAGGALSKATSALSKATGHLNEAQQHLKRRR